MLSFVTSICAMLLLWAVYPKDYDFGSATKVGLRTRGCSGALSACCCCGLYHKDYEFGFATNVKLSSASMFKRFVCTGGVQTLAHTLVFSQLMQSIRLHMYFVVNWSSAD